MSTIIENPKDMFHISFRNDKEGKWKPRLPDGIYSDKSKENELSEPDIPRICFSPTIRQCFLAVYPNISKYFKKDNYPYLVFSVYVPVNVPKDAIVSNREIINKKYVHDAHMTGESWITEEVGMVRVAEIEISNTNKSPDLYYYPFADVRKGSRYLGPKNVRFRTTKKFTNQTIK